MSAGGEAKLIQLSGIQMLGDTFFFPPTIVFFSSVAQKDPLSEKFSDTAYSYSRLSYCTSCI